MGAHLPALHAHAGRPELSLGLGEGSSAASQVLGHGCRPAQRESRLFLLAHRVAHVQEASQSHRVWKEDRHVRFRGRSVHHVSEKVSKKTAVAKAVRPVRCIREIAGLL